MKKNLIALACILMCLGAMAQGRIETKKFRISDFSDRITKVVMTGNEFIDAALRQEVMNRWTLSPYEFCTLAEFEANKKRAQALHRLGLLDSSPDPLHARTLLH